MRPGAEDWSLMLDERDQRAGRAHPGAACREARRLGAFSDTVLAVIAAIMVLQLQLPEQASLVALAKLWPTALSYAVSYAFLAISWINRRRQLARSVRAPSDTLIWLTFLNLFLVSLVPFSTQWVARTRLGADPVMVWALVFGFADVAHMALEREVMAQAYGRDVSDKAEHRARRSLLSVAILAAAAGTAPASAALGVALICLALVILAHSETRV
jgi:uncharacterized membrane protein